MGQEVKSGKILIAEPFMGDPNFARSVVLLCEHHKEGSFGLILNKPIEASLVDVMPDIETFTAPLYYGGPCDRDTLHYIHQYPEIENTIEVCPNLFWGGDFEQLKRHINLGLIDYNSIRFFIGYSGWSAGQLDGELSRKDWIINNPLAASTMLNGSPEVLWKQVLENMGGAYKIMSNYPVDPRLN